MIDELKLLESLPGIFSPDASVTIPPGDDCAEFVTSSTERYLAAADQLVEQIHFDEKTSPEVAGAKLLNRNLSDIAAMGGTPCWALLTIAANGKTTDYLLEFFRGVARAAKKWQIPVIGGDCASLPEKGLVATLTIIGKSPAAGAIKRSGASAGEYLYVSGKIGNSYKSGRHLTFTPRIAEGAFLAENRLATAMLDVSDGLLLDAQRLASASQVDLKIEIERIPLNDDAVLPQALSDGEDYELLFTSPCRDLEKFWKKEFAPLTRIGRVVPGNGKLVSPNGDAIKDVKLGYVH